MIVQVDLIVIVSNSQNYKNTEKPTIPSIISKLLLRVSDVQKIKGLSKVSAPIIDTTIVSLMPRIDRSIKTRTIVPILISMDRRKKGETVWNAVKICENRIVFLKKNRFYFTDVEFNWELFDVLLFFRMVNKLTIRLFQLPQWLSLAWTLGVEAFDYETG